MAASHLEDSAGLRGSPILDQRDGKVCLDGLAAWVVEHVVLTRFDFFAPQVFLIEVIISVALLLGIWTGSGLCWAAAMAVNLSQGLYPFPE